MTGSETVDGRGKRRPTISGGCDAAAADEISVGRPISAFCVFVIFAAAALPMRIWAAIGPFQSFSVLDIALLAVGSLLLGMMLAGKKLYVGDPWLFALLSVPLVLSSASLVWTLDETETIRSAVVYGEALVGYVFVVTFLRGQTPNVTMCIAVAFVVMLIAAGVFMWIGVPHFEPQDMDIAEQETLVSYYARLSHPYLGRSNNVAGILALYVFPFAAWARYRRSAIFYLFVGFTGLALLLTLSRGVILAVLVTMVVASAISMKRLFRLLLGSMAVGPLLVVAAFAVIAEVPIAAEYLEQRLSFANVLVRLDMIDLAIAQLDERPLTGAGAGAIGAIEPRLAEGVHNTFLEQMLNFGIPFGTILGLCLILIPWRLRAMDRVHGKTLIGSAIYLAVFCQLLVFMTQTSFEGSILRIIFYMSIGWCVVLMAVVSNERPGVGSLRRLS